MPFGRYIPYMGGHMFKSRVVIVLFCALALGAGIFACGSSDETDPGCWYKPEEITWQISKDWIIQPNALDEVASFVSIGELGLDGVGNITAHGYMEDPAYGTASLSSCSYLTMSIQNSMDINASVWATYGTIYSFAGIPVSGNMYPDKPNILQYTGLTGSLTETCAPGDTEFYSDICDGTTYTFDINAYSSNSIYGTITEGTDIFTIDPAKSVALSDGEYIVLYLQTNAPVGALEPYGMIRLSVLYEGISSNTGKYHLDSDVDGPVGTVTLSIAPIPPD